VRKQFLLLLLTLLAGCATAPKNTLTQISTIDALLAGAYDGQMTTGNLLHYGSLGIGTFDGLEGEMIVIDRQVYQARADGSVCLMPTNTTTPFASVVNFKADSICHYDGALDEKMFQDFADGLAPNSNLFVAVRFDGHFPLMKVRSVPKQEKPYPPLAEVVQHQTVAEYASVNGTVLGFRCPSFVKGVNVPGWHLHFISDDRTKGGHILSFTTTGGELKLDSCNRFYMALPDQEQFGTLDLSKDRSEELQKVEK